MLSGRQEAAARDLAQWWEGIRRGGTGSRAVLLAVPAGWGRSTVLDQLAGAISRTDAPATLVARISGRSLPDRPGPQAVALREHLMGAGVRQRAAEMLCRDRLRGTGRLSAAGLFASSLAAALSFLQTGLAVAAAGAAGDDSPQGENGPLARAARTTAAVSEAAPVVVMIDDADALEPGLAVTLIENLIGHQDSRVLVIVVVDPGSGLASALTSRPQNGRTAGRVHRAEADPRMGYKSRADLAGELCPHLPAVTAQRLARRTQTFGDVFAAAGSGPPEPGLQIDACSHHHVIDVRLRERRTDIVDDLEDRRVRPGRAPRAG